MPNPISVRNDPMGKVGGAQKELCEFCHKRLRPKQKWQQVYTVCLNNINKNAFETQLAMLNILLNTRGEITGRDAKQYRPVQCDRLRINSFVTIQLANIKCNVKYVHATEICNSTRFKWQSRFERVDTDDITDDLSTFSTGYEIYL